MISSNELYRDYNYPWEYSNTPDTSPTLRQQLNGMSSRVRDFTTALRNEIVLGVHMATEDALTSFEEMAPTVIQLTKYVTALSLPVLAAIIAHEQLNTIRDQGAAFGLVGIALLSSGIAIEKIRQPDHDSLPKLRKNDPHW